MSEGGWSRRVKVSGNEGTVSAQERYLSHKIFPSVTKKGYGPTIMLTTLSTQCFKTQDTVVKLGSL